MKQINNGFKEYYYIDSDYKVYNSKSKKYLKADRNGCYTLIRESGKPYHISNNILLKTLFGSTFVLKDVESLPDEEWKQINDSCYFCSNLGRIKSNLLLESKVLVPDKSTSYERVKIDIGNGTKNYLIHKIVATLFLEPPKEPFMVVHHINNNKLCNKAENLVFLSPEEHRKLHAQENKGDSNNE